jgi:murein DD-endopeptidase MepM/ murein hydrolase activator NlpD
MNWQSALGLLLCLTCLGSPATHVSGQFNSTIKYPADLSQSALDAEIANLLDKIETDSNRHTRLQTELDGLADERKRIRKGLRHRFRALYRVTRLGILSGQGGFDTIVQRIARVKRLERLVRGNLSRLRRLEGQKKRLGNDRKELAESLRKSRTRLDELQQRAEHKRQQHFAVTERSNVYSSQGNPGSYRSQSEEFYGVRMVDRDTASAFPAMRGKLAFPVVGDFVVRDARRDESDGQGLEFQTALGTEVRAAAAGRVGFSERYGSYGRLVILDHGDNYYTIYGGLDRVEVRVGDDLSRNARIGRVGNENSPPALFFEVRHGTKTLEPRRWLGL